MRFALICSLYCLVGIFALSFLGSDAKAHSRSTAHFFNFMKKKNGEEKSHDAQRERNQKEAIDKAVKNVVEEANRNRRRMKRKERILYQNKLLEPTCSWDFYKDTYDGVCSTKQGCFLTVIDRDGHSRSAGALYARHKAGPKGSTVCGDNLSCCADVKCLEGHGHCIDTSKMTCKHGTVRGQCPGGKTIYCCPFNKNSVQKWNQIRFANNIKCLGGRGICRFKNTGKCDHPWVRGQCGSGNEVCCPSSATAKSDWEREKLKAQCDYVGPAAKLLGLDITTLMAFVKVESGGSASAIRFECHRFKKLDKANGLRIPCTIKKGDSFSRVKTESGAAAFKRAYALNKVAAIKSTSFGLFQIMGGYLLAGVNEDPVKALKLFEKNPKEVSLQLLVLWFKDPSWGSRAAKSARKITSVHIPAEQKYWNELVKMYNGPGQVPYYVGKLKEAWSYYKGKCPSADSYDAEMVSKKNGINSDKEIKVATFGDTGRGIFDSVRRLLRFGSPLLMGNGQWFAQDSIADESNA